MEENIKFMSKLFNFFDSNRVGVIVGVTYGLLGALGRNLLEGSEGDFLYGIPTEVLMSFSLTSYGLFWHLLPLPFMATILNIIFWGTVGVSFQMFIRKRRSKIRERLSNR